MRRGDTPAAPRTTASCVPSCGPARTPARPRGCSFPRHDTPAEPARTNPPDTSPRLPVRATLTEGYRRSHFGPPQPDQPAASVGDYCAAVLRYDRTLKVGNFRSTKVGNFQSQLTATARATCRSGLATSNPRFFSASAARATPKAGSLCSLLDPRRSAACLAYDINLGSIVTYSQRLRREVGEFHVGSCICRDLNQQRSHAFIHWAAARTTPMLGAIRE